MPFQIGNQYGVTSGGGPPKAGDIRKLLQIWFGIDIKLEDVQPKQKKFLRKKIIDVPIGKKNKDGVQKTKKRLVREEVLIDYWDSGFDAMCYKILTGQDRMILPLLNKLYADQKSVLVDDKNNLLTRSKLKEASNEELEELETKLVSEGETPRDSARVSQEGVGIKKV